MRQLKLFKHLNNTNIDFIENILIQFKAKRYNSFKRYSKASNHKYYKVDSHKIRTIGLGFNPKLFSLKKTS